VCFLAARLKELLKKENRSKTVFKEYNGKNKKKMKSRGVKGLMKFPYVSIQTEPERFTRLRGEDLSFD
jgi:hypothetical protein